MVERKLFKTKLCVLYQRGHCSRQSCSFAHGEADLRRFSDSSYARRRDYRDRDLRDKLERRFSPKARYSAGKDVRGQHAFRIQRSFHGYSPSRSSEKKSERFHKRKQYLDGQHDFSENLEVSNKTEDRVKGGRMTPSYSKTFLEEKLQDLHSDISKLENHKQQLGSFMEEKVQEADTLTSRIQELEAQLQKEREEYKRISLKIRKFVKAHKRCTQMQDELTRSQVRFQKLGEQLGSNISRISGNEEDSNINIISDGETAGGNAVVQHKEIRGHSPKRKRLRVSQKSAEELTPEDGKDLEGAARLEKRSRWNNLDIVVDLQHTGNDNDRHLANGGKLSRGKKASGIQASDKLRGIGSVPSTSMAAHAVDELVEIEGDEKVEIADNVAIAMVKEKTFEHDAEDEAGDIDGIDKRGNVNIS